MSKNLIWTLPRSRKDNYPEAFPLHFEKKLWKLLGCPSAVLHPFGGKAQIGVRVDTDPAVLPDYVGDAQNLYFIAKESYDLIILDPPQSYPISKTPFKTAYSKWVKEALRVCRKGGFLAVYSPYMLPKPPKTRLWGRVIVLTKAWHKPRVCNIFQKIGAKEWF